MLVAWWWRAALHHCCYNTLFVQWEENLPGYLDIFAFGMITAHVFTRFGDAWRATLLRYAGPIVAVAGVALLVALLQSLYDYRFSDQWAGVWQVNNRPLLGGAFAVIAFGWLVSPRWWQILLDNLPLRFLAAISYNLYLYHQLVARELFAHKIPPYSGDPHYEDPAWQIRFTQLACALNVALATLVTYCFERPLLKVRLKDDSREIRGDRNLDLPALEGRDKGPQP